MYNISPSLNATHIEAKTKEQVTSGKKITTGKPV